MNLYALLAMIVLVPLSILAYYGCPKYFELSEQDRDEIKATALKTFIVVAFVFCQISLIGLLNK